jgi:hypothetical protein
MLVDDCETKMFLLKMQWQRPAIRYPYKTDGGRIFSHRTAHEGIFIIKRKSKIKADPSQSNGQAKKNASFVAKSGHGLPTNL